MEDSFYDNFGLLEGRYHQLSEAAVMEQYYRLIFWNHLVLAASKNVIGICPPGNKRCTGIVLS